MGFYSKRAIFTCYAACFFSIQLVHCEMNDNGGVNCGPMEFLCHGYDWWYGPVSTCIDAASVCDTVKDCGDGTDEANCPTDCSGQHQFKCQSDDKCISIRDRCDGLANCHDHSDEAYCSSFRCPTGFTKCDNNIECYTPENRCNGFGNCMDGSDEKDCVTGQCDDNHFECKDGSVCLPLSFVCDHNGDCHDFSDEANCNLTCTSRQFDCGANGTTKCIGNDYLCDGNDDCGNGKDESLQTCHGKLDDENCSDLMRYESCFFMNKTVHPICTIHADAHKICRKYCNLCDNSSS